MSEPSLTGESQRKQQKNKLVSATQLTGDQVATPEGYDSLLGGIEDNSRPQVNRLSDHRFQAIQRRSMAAHIGRVSGNRHLQGILSQINNQRQDKPINRQLNTHNEQNMGRDTKPPLIISRPTIFDVQQQSKETESEENLTEPVHQSGTDAIQLQLDEEQSLNNNRSSHNSIGMQNRDKGIRKDVVQRRPRNQTVRQLSTKLPAIQTSARLVDASYRIASNYVDLAIASIDMLSTKLQIFSLNYDMAYNRYSNVIGEGRAEAQNQTLWRGIFLGIGTSILSGIAAAYILPSTAAGWFTITLAEAGTAAVSNIFQSAASSAIGYAVEDIIKTRGSDLQPDGLSPDMLRSNIWQHMASMYRGVFEINKVLANLHRNNVILERLAAEMRVHIAGGSSQFSAEDILRAANIMNNRMDRMEPVFNGLSQKSTALGNFSSSISNYDHSKPGVDQMEKDIWILWMASLSDDDSDILDLDKIEDHLHSDKIRILGKGGVLGVDFGDYTSEEDELAALAAARSEAANIRSEYDNAVSKWTLPNP